MEVVVKPHVNSSAQREMIPMKAHHNRIFNFTATIIVCSAHKIPTYSRLTGSRREHFLSTARAKKKSNPFIPALQSLQRHDIGNRAQRNDSTWIHLERLNEHCTTNATQS